MKNLGVSALLISMERLAMANNDEGKHGTWYWMPPGHIGSGSGGSINP
jgi:hypothetical protein